MDTQGLWLADLCCCDIEVAEEAGEEPPFEEVKKSVCNEVPQVFPNVSMFTNPRYFHCTDVSSACVQSNSVKNVENEPE